MEDMIMKLREGQIKAGLTTNVVKINKILANTIKRFTEIPRMMNSVERM